MERKCAQDFFSYWNGHMLTLLSELYYETLLVQLLFLTEELFISFSNHHFQQWEMAVLTAKRLARRLFYFVFSSP